MIVHIKTVEDGQTLVEVFQFGVERSKFIAARSMLQPLMLPEVEFLSVDEHVRPPLFQVIFNDLKGIRVERGSSVTKLRSLRFAFCGPESVDGPGVGVVRDDTCVVLQGILVMGLHRLVHLVSRVLLETSSLWPHYGEDKVIPFFISYSPSFRYTETEEQCD